MFNVVCLRDDDDEIILFQQLINLINTQNGVDMVKSWLDKNIQSKQQV